jgi:serine/threonine-protein phosphatase PGAM5
VINHGAPFPKGYLFWAVVAVAFGVSGLARAGETPAVAPASAYTRTIYLVRHGAYEIDGKGDEDTGHGLTPLGIAQARLVAARLRGMPVTFTSLTASTMTRARQTAEIINRSLPQLTLKTDRLLRECLPRTSRTEVTKGMPPAELDAAEAQLDQAFAAYFVPAKDLDRSDILVCHGNVIRSFVMRALGVDARAWLGLSVAHCSLTIIQISSTGSFKVLAVGDSGHIPSTMVSGLVKGPTPELVAP